MLSSTATTVGASLVTGEGISISAAMSSFIAGGYTGALPGFDNVRYISHI
jgi:hypothetical protein